MPVQACLKPALAGTVVTGACSVQDTTVLVPSSAKRLQAKGLTTAAKELTKKLTTMAKYTEMPSKNVAGVAKVVAGVPLNVAQIPSKGLVQMPSKSLLESLAQIPSKGLAQMSAKDLTEKLVKEHRIEKYAALEHIVEKIVAGKIILHGILPASDGIPFKLAVGSNVRTVLSTKEIFDQNLLYFVGGNVFAQNVVNDYLRIPLISNQNGTFSAAAQAAGSDAVASDGTHSDDLSSLNPTEQNKSSYAQKKYDGSF